MNTISSAMVIPAFEDGECTEKGKLTIEDFIAYLDANPNKRVELINGQVIEMAGGTLNHSIISSNCLDVKFFLRENKPNCRVCNSDFGIQTKENQVRYPDFSIVCDAKGTDRVSGKPLVVGEVLSEKSTAHFDKAEKLEEYKNVHSIKEIFLISQTKKEVIAYRRGTFFGWDCQVYTSGMIEFHSIGYSVDIDDLYMEVDFGNN